MKQTLLVLIFALPLFSFAQRDAPVWKSCLTRISIYDNNRTSSVHELDYKKEGGHYLCVNLFSGDVSTGKSMSARWNPIAMIRSPNLLSCLKEHV